MPMKMVMGKAKMMTNPEMTKMMSKGQKSMSKKHKK